jgi:hypothetical protein
MLVISKKQNAVMIEELEICLHEFIKFVQNIPMDKFDFRCEGKWTIKEIIQHVIDREHFSYRALRISRNDKPPLPGFDEMSMLLTQMPMMAFTAC